MSEQDLKPIVEAKYLASANAWRYRAILRFFYIQHERLRHYLFPEEIYDHLKSIPQFHNYTQEQLEQDLNQLVEWNNLIPRQETGKVQTIEDFKRKKFRYQCTPYTIEFERLIQGLEKMGDSFGGSLERTLFDRFLEALLKLTAYKTPDFGQNMSQPYESDHMSDEELFAAWEEMYDHFRKLTENATDYLAYLKSEKVEEAMMTEAFLAFKDVLTQYLRNFMAALQRSSFRIETILADMPADWLDQVTRRLADYQLSIPRLEEHPSHSEWQKQYKQQWTNMKHWFLGSDGRQSELSFLQNETNETIRRITRYVQRLGEKQHNFKSRKRDYLHLALWFSRMDDVREAHKLSAVVFGLFHTRHLYAETKQSEDIQAEVWDLPPTTIILKPRVKSYREKTKPGAVISHTRQKEAMLREYLEQKEREQRLIESLVQGDTMILSELPTVDPYVRKTILTWIGKCMASPDHCTKTETGRRIRLLKLSEETITLTSMDGVLRMPNYAFQFLD